MNRSRLLPRGAVRAGLALLLVVASGACSRSEKRWNVLLVTLDTTRADYLGCYGRPGDPTPNFDALAAEGTRFDLAIASAAVTPVSHASILTGLDPREHKVRVISAFGGFRLPSDVPTLATVLKDAGYATAAVHSAFPVSGYYGFDRGFDVFESFDGVVQQGNAGNMTWDLQRLQRRSDETTDLVLDTLGKSGRPFFLWVHYWDPHDDAKIPPPEHVPAHVPRDARGRPLGGRELYAAEVTYTDFEFGRLVASLKERGEWERTLVVVVADHGEGLGDHGWLHHRVLYQEQIRVPLIVRPPEVPEVADTAALVRTSDIFPTVLDYVGAAHARPVAGRTLRALMDGKPDAPRWAYADQINGYDLNVAGLLDQRPYDDFVYCAMDARWKLVWRPAHPEQSELFDLANDPRESRNLFAKEAGERTRLQKLLARHGGWVTAPFEPEGSAKDIEAMQGALTALGYASGGTPATDARWAYTCVDHPTEQWIDPDPCPRCGEPGLLIARSK